MGAETTQNNKAFAQIKLQSMDKVLHEISCMDEAESEEELAVAIMPLLQAIGEYTGADRVYLFDWTDETHTAMRNTYEWCAAGVTAEIENLQALPINLSPDWMARFRRKEPVIIENIEDIRTSNPVECAILQAQDVHSMIAVPIYAKRELRGVIGMDNPREGKDEFSLHLLTDVGGHLGSVRETIRSTSLLKTTLDDATNSAEIISSLATLYTMIVSGNVKTRIYEVIVGNEQIYKLARQSGSWDEWVDVLLEMFVAAPMRAALRDFLNPDTLAQRMRTTNTVVYEFLDTDGGWRLARYIVKSRDANGDPAEILYVGRNITAEKRQEHEYQEKLRRSAEEISKARRPMLLAGGGVILSNGSRALRELAQTLHLPVAYTLMGLGAFPATDPLSLGMVGMHGTYAANMSINHTDLLICVGARFDDRVTGKLDAFAPSARIIHIDIDPTSIRKNVEVDVPVVGDCRLALEGILDICRAKLGGRDWEEEHGEWLRTVADWKADHPLRYSDEGTAIKPQKVVETLFELTRGDAILTTEVGQNQMWTAQFYNFTEPRTLLTSGGLGTMGYGFPAAIGAQMAFPHKKVISVAGDGSLQMNIQELATVVQQRLPIKVVILNNGYLGMVRQWQELFFNHNYSSTVMEAQPDFVKLAEAYGAEGYRITERRELLPMLQTALASPNPAVIDVRVEREENVYPMVPAGAALDEMLLI